MLTGRISCDNPSSKAGTVFLLQLPTSSGLICTVLVCYSPVVCDSVMLAGRQSKMLVLLVFLWLAPAPRRSGAELLETQGVTVSVEDERGRNDRLDINSEGFVVDADREVGPRSWPWTVSIGYWDPLSPMPPGSTAARAPSSPTAAWSPPPPVLTSCPTRTTTAMGTVGRRSRSGSGRGTYTWR